MSDDVGMVPSSMSEVPIQPDNIHVHHNYLSGSLPNSMITIPDGIASNIRVDGNPCLCGVISSAILSMFNTSGTQLGSPCGSTPPDSSCQAQLDDLSHKPVFNSSDVQGIGRNPKQGKELIACCFIVVILLLIAKQTCCCVQIGKENF